MIDRNEEEMQDDEREQDNSLEIYGEDPQIASFEGKKIPLFLILTYLFLPVWGAFEFYWFWNGSSSLFDSGYVSQLQAAAGTTFPTEDATREKNILTAEE